MTPHRANRDEGRGAIEPPPAAEEVERFLIATESAELAEQCRRMTTTLFARVAVEIVPEDGRVVLSRLPVIAPRFAFVPTSLRHLDSLTLLRALPPSLAERVILLVPSTLDGYRDAWEGLRLGAADAFPTPRHGATRIKGDEARWLRRLALLTGDAPSEAADTPLSDRDESVVPWVIYPELRQLPALVPALRQLAKHVPLVLRVPEGPRVFHVVREELDRSLPWPTRELVDSDLLVPGHLHLFTEPWLLRLESTGRRWRARLCPPMTARRGIAPRNELLSVLGGSAGAFRFTSGEPLEPEELARVGGSEPARRSFTSIASLLSIGASSEERRAA